MKRRAVILAVGLGLGVTISSFAAGLTNETIVGSVNTINTDAATNEYAVVAPSDEDFFILNSSISSRDGTNKVFSANIPANQFAVGRGGVSSSGTTDHLVNISNSAIAGGKGGAVRTTGSFNGANRTLNVNGAVGLRVQNGTIVINDSSIKGGAGGTIDTVAANSASSAQGAAAILLSGSGSLTSTNAVITGGQGGQALDRNRSGMTASGGAGIRVGGGTQVINLVDTTVTGGAGGRVLTNGTANGAAGLLISGGADVTVQNGIFDGGSPGTAARKTGSAGAAIEVQGSTLTLAGGTLKDNLLLSSGTSTLSLKDTFDGATVVQTAGTSTFDEWYDGQLSDVTVSGGTMNFTGNMFNLTNGVFKLTSSSATAKFNNGLNVNDKGVLNIGVATVTSTGFHASSNGVIRTGYNGGTALGKLTNTGALTLDSGAKWFIDGGANVVNEGQTFNLATSTGAITNNMDLVDVRFVGTMGQWGWLGGIVTFTPQVSASGTLAATYGRIGIADALDVSEDDTTDYGKVVNMLDSLVTQDSDAYANLAAVTPYVDAAGGFVTNGYLRTPEMAQTLTHLQTVFSDQIKDRTRSQLRYEGVGYPEESMPAGAAGWDWMRDISDNLEQGYGYDQVKDAMNNAAPDISQDNMGLPQDYQIWGRGYGVDVEQDTRTGFTGYDATIAGGILGVDKRINNMLLGLGGGYTHTEVKGLEEKDGSADTLNAVAYCAVHGKRGYLDANVDYAFSSVDTEYEPLGYSADYNAHTLGLYIGGGYGISLFENLLFTPEASMQATLYKRETYTDRSSLDLPDKRFQSYDEWSYLSSVGATLTMINKIEVGAEEIGVQPELRAHWLHEGNADMKGEAYRMGGDEFMVALLPREEDLAKIGAGLRFSKWASDTTEFGIDFDSTFGDDYTAYMISGKLMHRF